MHRSSIIARFLTTCISHFLMAYYLLCSVVQPSCRARFAGPLSADAPRPTPHMCPEVAEIPPGLPPRPASSALHCILFTERFAHFSRSHMTLRDGTFRPSYLPALFFPHPPAGSALSYALSSASFSSQAACSQTFFPAPRASCITLQPLAVFFLPTMTAVDSPPRTVCFSFSAPNISSFFPSPPTVCVPLPVLPFTRPTQFQHRAGCSFLLPFIPSAFPVCFTPPRFPCPFRHLSLDCPFFHLLPRLAFFLCGISRLTPLPRLPLSLV